MAFAQDAYPLAEHCPEDYFEARERFRHVSGLNSSVTERIFLPIQAKGPFHSDLSIDITIMGSLERAHKVLFVISGTHGVEGGPGSGIQHAFLTKKKVLPGDTAIIFIHALNPFGMAWNRRVNESNIDLNRNGVSERITPLLYGEIDPIYNPKEIVPFNAGLWKELVGKYGEGKARVVLLGGQYSFPEGLFYGGSQQTESLSVVLKWCRENLTRIPKRARFGIIDIHSGLGAYGEDTLLTYEAPTEAMKNFFGSKMDPAVQMATAGYRAAGVFNKELSDCIKRIDGTASVFAVGQEFGTIDEPKVIQALYEENMVFHHAKRYREVYDPYGKEGRVLAEAFYPREDRWRHAVVEKGLDLIAKSLDFLEVLPYEESYLRVSGIHQIHYSVYGNPEGIPVVVLHGGPGMGCSGNEIYHFDLSRYRVVLFDQRGARRSKPFACLEENTTRELIEDIEKLKKHLGIQKWLVFGRSWGSLLSLLYGEKYPDSCLGFVLQGIFLGRSQDINIFRKDSAEYDALIKKIPEVENESYLVTCYQAVIDPSPSTRLFSAKAFISYFLSTFGIKKDAIDRILEDETAVMGVSASFLHYAVNNLFISEGQALSNLGKIVHLPATLIHGNNDINCLPEQAVTLHEHWPSSDLILVNEAGHSNYEANITHAIRAATDSFLENIDQAFPF